MIHFRGEGERLRWGFNIYPWRERKYSRGFVFHTPWINWCFRYAPHIKRMYNYWETK